MFLSCLMARDMVLLSVVGGTMHPNDCVFSQWKQPDCMQPCVFFHFLFFRGLWHLIEQSGMCSSLVPILEWSGINNLRSFPHW